MFLDVSERQGADKTYSAATDDSTGDVSEMRTRKEPENAIDKEANVSKNL